MEHREHDRMLDLQHTRTDCEKTSRIKSIFELSWSFGVRHFSPTLCIDPYKH